MSRKTIPDSRVLARRVGHRDRGRLFVQPPLGPLGERERRQRRSVDALPGRSPERLRRQGEERPRGTPADRSGDRGGRGRPDAARRSRRRVDEAAPVRPEDAPVLRARLPADAGHGDRLLRSGVPAADRHQPDHDPAPHAERAGELRAHDAPAPLARRAAQRGDDDAAAHDDDGDEGALRVPRRVGGRRQRHRDRPLQQAYPKRNHHGGGVAGPHPHRRERRSHEPQLHALVRPRRRRRRGEGRGLPERPRHVRAERDGAPLSALRIARQPEELDRYTPAAPSRDRPRRAAARKRATSPTGRW